MRLSQIDKAIFFFIFLGSLAARAGNEAGGGYAIVCRGADGAITKAELLDPYEVKPLLHKELVPTSGSLEKDFLESVRRTYTLHGSPGDFDEKAAIKTLIQFFKLVEFTKPGEHLPYVNDIGKTVAPPPGCRFEQLVIFGGEQVIPAVRWGKIDTEIWKALDSQSQAALVQHELSYAHNKVLTDTNSEVTRAEVGPIFSQNVAPTLDGIPADSMWCGSAFLSSPYRQFICQVYPVKDSSGKPALTFQFSKIVGYQMVTKTTATFPGLTGLYFKQGYPTTVDDPKANYYSVQPLLGDQVPDWKVALKYVNGEPAKLSLIREGRPTLTLTTWCNKIYP